MEVETFSNSNLEPNRMYTALSPLPEISGNDDDFSYNDDDDEDDKIEHHISDTKIECRSVASLPIAFLSLEHIDYSTEIGVYARRFISKNTSFGPVEGVLQEKLDYIDVEKFEWLVKCSEGSLLKVDTSDKNLTNWMRYVRQAKYSMEQNLMLKYFENKGIYFITTTDIDVGDELKVWYSDSYSVSMGLPIRCDYGTLDSMFWKCSMCSVKSRESETVHNHIAAEHQDKLMKISQNYKNIKRHYLNSVRGEKLISHRTIRKRKRRRIKRSNRTEVLFCHNYSLKPHETCEIQFYHCSHCDLVFNTATLLNFHMLMHAAYNLESEQYCEPEETPIVPKKRKIKDPLIIPTVVYSSPIENLLPCNSCDRKFQSASGLATHKTYQHDCNKVSCPICEEKFEKISNLKIHFTTHSDKNGNYSCSHCDKIFKNYSKIRRHVNLYHSGREYSCAFCNRVFKNMDKLKSHLICHSDERKYLCANCGKSFKRKDKLGDHMKRAHDKLEEIVDINKTKKVKIRTTVTSNKSDNFNNYTYKCNFCLLGFKRRGMLVNHFASRHKEINLSEIPELHVPVFNVKKEFICQYCNKIYKTNAKRRLHILKYHPGQPNHNLTMKEIKQSKFDGSNIKFVQTIGSSATNPFGCGWCHKQYATRAKLNYHLREKHPNLPKNEKVLVIDKNISNTADIDKANDDNKSNISKKQDSNKNDSTSNNSICDKETDQTAAVISEVVNEKSPAKIDSSPKKMTTPENSITQDTSDGVFETEEVPYVEEEYIMESNEIKKKNYDENEDLTDCNSLNHLLVTDDGRQEQFFKVIQTTEVVAYVQPLEVWDPVQ